MPGIELLSSVQNVWKVDSFSPATARRDRVGTVKGTEELLVSHEATWIETKLSRAIGAETLAYQQAPLVF